MIHKIVYHAPDNATGLLTACPCCGESLLLDMRLLAPASPPPTLPEDGPAAVDGLTQPSAAAASGLPPKPREPENLTFKSGSLPAPDPMLSPDETWARRQMPPEERLYRAAVDVLRGGRRFGPRKEWRELREAVAEIEAGKRRESVAKVGNITLALGFDAGLFERALRRVLTPQPPVRDKYQPTRPLTGKPPRGHNPRVHDCCECAQWQEDYYGSEWGCCHSDLPGGRTMRKHGGCVNNFVGKWRDGNDD